MPRECRSTSSPHEIITAPAVQSPNQPHKTGRSLCNVPIKAGIALGSQSCYRSRRVRRVIRGLSAETAVRLAYGREITDKEREAQAKESVSSAHTLEPASGPAAKDGLPSHGFVGLVLFRVIILTTD